MIDQNIALAALAGIGLSLATGPLGAFMVWRRMAYFGDAVAHASILGVAIALAFSGPIVLGALAVALVVGVSVALLSTGSRPIDTNLGVLSHSALAIGLVGVSYFEANEIDLEGLLFGDILAVTPAQLALVWAGSFLMLAVLVWRWQALLTTTLSEEIAASAGINPRRERLILTLALALVVALALKVVGALLIGALLIIPAAAARGFSRTPEQMAAIAVAIGASSTVVGVFGSVLANSPTGPWIVVATTAFFLLSLLLGKALR